MSLFQEDYYDIYDDGNVVEKKIQRGSLLPAQAAFLNSNKRFAWFCAGIGGGKCLAGGTRLLLASGLFIEVQNLRTGDVLMGWDSTHRAVTSTCSGRDTMYEIKSNKFGSHIVNSHHIITVKHAVSGEIYDFPLQEFLKKSRKFQNECKLFKVPVEFEEKELPLDPYFAGLWIGRKNPSFKNLKKFGLYKNNVKNISHEYLTSSKTSRLKLLAGIIDSCGYYNEFGYNFVLEVKEKNILEQCLYLCRSLGFHADYINKNSVFKINVIGDIGNIPVLLNKNKAPKCDVKNDFLTDSFKIIKLEEDDYYGFTVEGDGRVILDNFVVTHNTHTGSIWAYKQLLRNPEVNGFIAANTFDQLHSATLPPFKAYLQEMGMECVINKRPPDSWGINQKFANYHNVLTCKNGAHIYLRSLDRPEPIRGIEIGWGWIDEVASSTEEAWNIITGRMRDARSDELQLRVTGSPAGDNWTWKEFRKAYSEDPVFDKDGNPKRKKDGTPLVVADLYDIIFMSSRDNPFLDDEFISSLIASYDPIKVLQEIDGRIVIQQDANFYYEFNSKLHITEMVKYDPTKPLYFCWDFNAGKETPMCSVLCQEALYEDGTRFIQVIDEIMMYNGNTPKVCEEFKRRYTGHKGGVYIFGDATGKTRGATTGVTDYQIMSQELQTTFYDLQFFVPDKNPPIVDRKNSVNAMFRNGYNDVRMFVHPRCVELIKDFKELKPDEKGGIEKSNPARSHLSDALGYYIVMRFPASIHDYERNYRQDSGVINF